MAHAGGRVDSPPGESAAAHAEKDSEVVQASALEWLLAVAGVDKRAVPAGTTFEDAIDNGKLLHHASSVVLDRLYKRKAAGPLRSNVDFLRPTNSSFWENRAAFADVEAFLTTAVSIGVSSEDLCTAADIMEHKDPRRVALTVLALYQAAVRKGVGGLPRFAGERGDMSTQHIENMRDRIWRVNSYLNNGTDMQDENKHKGGAGRWLRRALVVLTAGGLGAAGWSRCRPLDIKEGDTLWELAQRHLGEGKRYQRFLDKNPELIAHPDLIFPGDRVRQV